MLSSSQNLPGIHKTLFLQKLDLSNKKNLKINNEIETYFNDPGKYLDTSGDLIVGKKIDFVDYNDIKSPPRRYHNTHEPTKNSKPRYTLSKINTFRSKTEDDQTTEVLDQRRVKSLFESYKDPFVKSSFINTMGSQELDQEMDIPKSLVLDLEAQEKSLRKKQRSDLSSGKVAKYLSRKVNKPERDLLMNRIDIFRFKRELANSIENSKPLTNLYGKFKWTISLRRPDNFSGVREAYVNTRSDDNPFWTVVKERYPKVREICLKPECDTGYQEYAKYLKNPFLQPKDKQQKVKEIEKIEDLVVKGNDLYDVEYKNAMKNKKSILHKVFYENGKTILDKDINEVYGNEMIYKNYPKESSFREKTVV